MSEYSGVDRGLGHHVAGGRVVTFLGLHLFYFSSVATDGDVRSSRDVVWTSHIRDAVEAKLIAPRGHGVSRIHVDIFFNLISGDERDPDNKHRHSEMRDLHTVVAAGLRAKLLQRGELSGSYAYAFPKVHDDRGHDPDRQQQPETDEHLPLPEDKRQRHRADQTNYKRPAQPRHQIRQTRFLPTRDWSNTHQKHRGRHQRHEHEIEIR